MKFFLKIYSAREVVHSQISQVIAILQAFLKSPILYESCSTFSARLEISERDQKVSE
jgi:hypothetical protein